MIARPLPRAAQPAQEVKTRMSPMAGLDLSTPITGMKEGYALRLDDWVCRSDGLHTRDGYADVTSGHGGAITALMGYPGRIISATAAKLFDGSSEVATGQGGGSWQGALIANPGALHLFAVNGVNTPRRFNGTTWATATVTGTDATKWTAIVTHQRRLIAVERDSLNLWYLPLYAIGGAASVFPLHAQCQRGGSIAAIASLSGDGGRGPDDRLVIVTTEGELIVYAGSNPDAAESWKLQGVWTVPKPRGKRSFATIGGALALLTDKGMMPIPKVLAEKTSSAAVEALTARVDTLLETSMTEVVDSAAADMTLIGGGSKQLVMSDTGGWSRFAGLATATTWAEINGGLYFGTTGGHVRRYSGAVDGITPIRSFAVDAFGMLGSAGKKAFKRVRPLYTAAHPYVPRIETLTDYRDPPASWDAANVNDIYWQWPAPGGSVEGRTDAVTWPKQPMPWMRDQSPRLQPWRSIGGQGHTQALQLSVQTLSRITWTGYEIGFEKGGRL